MKRSLLIFTVLVIAVLLGIAYAPQFFESTDNSPGASSSSSSKGGSTTVSSSSVGRELACTDGKDNDGDKLNDCDDPDCAGSNDCRCGALSCGAEGNSCRAENGCICNNANGCEACHLKNDTCRTNADCCAGTGLSCQEIFVAGEGTEKRCMPATTFVCDITCEGTAGSTKGTWGAPTSCVTSTPPEGAEDCEKLTGACELSPNADRNKRKCWNT